MAWTKSGLFAATFVAQWGATQSGIDLTAAGAKLALWGSSVTPDFGQDTAYGTAPWDSGEVSGAGYTTGGPTLLNPTFVPVAGGQVAYDADNVQLDNSTITSEGGIIYIPSKSNRLWAAIWWGEPKETQDGTFLITWHSSGITLLNLAP